MKTQYSIYQINPARDNDRLLYLGYELNARLFGHFTVKPEIYDKVYDGECGRLDSLEGIYMTLNMHLPEDYKCRSLSVSALCRRMGVTVKLYSPTDGNSGTAQVIDGKAVIFVKRDDIAERQRFTAAHELGHILLGHAGKFELINRGEPSEEDVPIEQAANVFASRLLAPACVLWGVGVKSAVDIRNLCGLSATAAEYRWKRMQVLYERDKFLTSPLEREVFEQFKPFISDVVGRVRQ